MISRFAMLVYMNKIVHARLDEETSDLLQQLKSLHGWSDSEVVRQAIHALGVATLPDGSVAVEGVGQFESGTDDLGSNSRHLEGFGT